jgi:hypothetical protein
VRQAFEKKLRAEANVYGLARNTTKVKGAKNGRHGITGQGIGTLNIPQLK